MILPSSQNDRAIFASERHIHKFIGEFCLNHNVLGKEDLVVIAIIHRDQEHVLLNLLEEG